MNKKLTILAALAAILLLGGIYVGLCYHSVDKHECGFTYDRFSGEITLLERQGWFLLAWPKYDVHAIDCRPYQLRITADIKVGDRVLNAKLVQFNPKGIKEFVAWHGRDAGDDAKNLKEILKCYAFSPDGGASCPFLEVVSETKLGSVIGVQK